MECVEVYSIRVKPYLKINEIVKYVSSNTAEAAYCYYFGTEKK